MDVKYTDIMEHGDIISVSASHHLTVKAKEERKSKTKSTWEHTKSFRVNAKITAIDDIKQMVKFESLTPIPGYFVKPTESWRSYNQMNSMDVRIIKHSRVKERIVQEVHVHQYRGIFGAYIKTRTNIIHVRLNENKDEFTKDLV